MYFLYGKINRLPEAVSGHISINLSMYLFPDSESWLGKSKEFNNQRMKVKRAFKNYSFSVTKKNNRKTDRFCMKISSSPNASVQSCLNFTFQNQALICFPVFFEEYVNFQDSINTMVKEHTTISTTTLILQN